MVMTATAATPLPSRGLESGAEAVCSTVGCGGAEAMVPALALLVTGALTVLFGMVLRHVHDAEGVLETERERVVAEREAFAAFAERVADLKPTSPDGGRVGALPKVQSSPPAGRLDDVRSAYRDTVMAVDHFEEDYGETYPESLAAEFGDGVAAAAVNGDALTPQLRGALVAGASEARAQRGEYLAALNAEAETVRDARERLSDVAAALDGLRGERLDTKGFRELSARWDRIRELEADCEALLRERQESRNGGHALGREAATAEEFHEFLYEDLPVAHPVLADGVTLVKRARALRHDVLRALTAGPSSGQPA